MQPLVRQSATLLLKAWALGIIIGSIGAAAYAIVQLMRWVDLPSQWQGLAGLVLLFGVGTIAISKTGKLGKVLNLVIESIAFPFGDPDNIGLEIRPEVNSDHISPPPELDVDTRTISEPSASEVSMLLGSINADDRWAPHSQLLNLATRFRRHSIFNIWLIHLQRPGAAAIASRDEWERIGRSIAPDASPVIILWPFAPVVLLYELEDTLPAINREAIGDPFFVSGSFNPIWTSKLKTQLEKQSYFKVQVRLARRGFGLAGTAATASGPKDIERVSAPVPMWRVTLNDRLTDAEQFLTLAHELGHIFCGHVGACHSNPRRPRDSGWPDRSSLGHHEMEIEAELVAWLVAKRAGLSTGSNSYLSDHKAKANPDMVNLQAVAAAAARIEKLAGVTYRPSELQMNLAL